ncbi:MAG TPA: hypothetical protein VGV36_07320 [Solirubrobacteraceae bacterium]|nr:hypothetical protein [Solirubrobacteraceae bacterium]
MSTGPEHREDQPEAGSEAGEERPSPAVNLPPTEEPTPAQLAEGPALFGPGAVTRPSAPEPAVPVSESSHRQPPGTAVPLGGPDAAVSGAPAERPEVLVGAAFAGGLVLAMLLRRALS